MSTIDPTTIDVTKPEEGEATTASVRANELATQNQLQAAKTDIEALESGKEDAGTAAAEVAAHDASGAAHGGVEAAYGAHAAAGNPHTDSASLTDLSAHKSGGTGEHPAFSDVQAGFAPASGGGTDNYLRADGSWQPPPGGGGAGTYNEVEKDSTGQSVGRAKIDFRDTGDATVTVTDDPGNDRTIVSIDATAGGGGGGVGKGNPFAVGELTEVESAAGDGSIRTTGLTAGTVSSHIASTSNPHSVTHAQTSPVADEHVAHSDVSITAGDGLSGGGTIAATRSLDVDATVQRRISGGTNGNLVSRDANGDVQDSGSSASDFDAAGTAAAAVAAHEAAGDPHNQYLQNVVEDASPQLGGNLETKGNEVHLTRADDSVHGIVGALSADNGAYIAYSPDGTTYDPADGALEVAPGKLVAHGAAMEVPVLKHATPQGRQVYASTDGYLYGVDPPEPGWLSSDTDTGFYPRSGVGLNVWQEITGLSGVSFQQDVQSGDPVDYVGSVFTRETTGNRSGTVEIGFGINGAQPIGPAQAFFIPSNFAGFLTASARTITVTATSGDTLELWVRVTSQDNAQFSTGLQFDGSAGNDHELVLSIPGGGGGGGGGDVLQGVVGSDGDITSWDNATGKVLGSTGFQASDVARVSVANIFAMLQTVLSGMRFGQSGAGQQAQTLDAAAGPYTLAANPLLGNLIRVTGTGDVTIEHLTEDATALVQFATTIGNVSAGTGVTFAGVDPGNGEASRHATIWTRDVGTTPTTEVIWIKGA